MEVKGILHLYHHPLVKNASTIREHIFSFEQYSRFKVWSINTELGFPSLLKDLDFRIIVLHYSLFAPNYYRLDDVFMDYLEHKQGSFKIAFFQDEYHACQKRFAFIDYLGINVIYTLLESPYAEEVYGRHTRAGEIFSVLPGYVSDDLVRMARRWSRPRASRRIDIGYRGRVLPYYMGREAREKAFIGQEFKRRAAGSGFKLDIEVDEKKRIYGQAWYRFLADCRAILGVEAGVSVFDLQDEVKAFYERVIRQRPNLSFREWEDLAGKLLERWEGKIFYRTISPRHFEAAAFRIVQVLFEGRYSGILEPYRHYIPLKKDFSNFDEVMAMLQDEAFCKELTENAYEDLIASGRYSYRRFVESFDKMLVDHGFSPKISRETVVTVSRRLGKGKLRRWVKAYVLFTNFRYRKALAVVLFPFRKPIQGLLKRFGIRSFTRQDFSWEKYE